MKQFERDQLRKLHAFVQTLPSPDPEQQKRSAEETTQQRQRLKEAYEKPLQLYSDVYLGVGELRQKTVTEILVHYGTPSFQGEYEQIAQLVEAAEAAESWDTGKADKHVREAVSLAIEIKLRRKEVADSILFEEAYDKVVKGAEGICVKAVCDREELDLVSPSSESSSAGFENSDLPVQADEPPETAAAVQQENCGGESPNSETDSTESESEEPPAAAAWIWQRQRQQQGKYVSPAHSHDRSAMMGGKMCR